MAKLLYLVTEAGYFFSHRYALAKAAQKQGYTILVATIPGSYHQRLIAEGFQVLPLKKMTRAGINPFKQLASLVEIYRIYRQEKPDIVHHVAMKPVMYGSIAAWLAGVKAQVNALAGLGYVFISSSLKAKVLRRLIWKAFKILFKGPCRVLILQNKDDFKLFSEIVPSKNLALIRGSGVNTQEFCPSSRPPSHPLLKVILVARLLWDKGIQETIDAVQILKQKGLSFEFILAGDIDTQNPSGIPKAQVEAWQEKGLCTWLGKVDNVAKFYQESDIAVLPSYREGLPKSLLEAAACGLPIVTTDVPGCREVVQHGKTGLLVPVRTVLPLANALEDLLTKPSLRHKLGKASRLSVERNFSEQSVIRETLEIYTNLD